MSQSRIHATIKFQTGLGGVRHVTKLWNGQSHIDNYVTFMKRRATPVGKEITS